MPTPQDLAKALAGYVSQAADAVPKMPQILSAAEAVKRRIVGFAGDPVGYVQAGVQDMIDQNNADPDAYGKKIAANLMGFAPVGMIKASGTFPKSVNYPAEFNGRVVTPVIGSLPPSQAYDMGGMFGGGAAAFGGLRKLDNGDYLATVTPQWTSKTKPFYAVGDNPEELVARAQQFMQNSGNAVQRARVAQIPADVRSGLEGQFGKVFDYDISNAANSKSYYITHRPSGTKIRVSDHDLPSYYEQPDIDLRPYDIDDIGTRLSQYLKGE